jgi:hypothetical protein
VTGTIGHCTDSASWSHVAKICKDDELKPKIHDNILDQYVRVVTISVVHMHWARRLFCT